MMRRLVVPLVFLSALSGCHEDGEKPHAPGLSIGYVNESGMMVEANETITDEGTPPFRGGFEGSYWLPLEPGRNGRALLNCDEENHWDEFRVRTRDPSDHRILDDKRWVHLECRDYDMIIGPGGTLTLRRCCDNRPTWEDELSSPLHLAIAVPAVLLLTAAAWFAVRRVRGRKE